MLERRRAKREIHCDSYAVYRSRLNSFKSARATIFHERAYSLPRELVNLKEPKGYHEKDRENFDEEWKLYLRPNTTFDECVKQFFSEGWLVTLIKGTGRHFAQLKQIEAKKKGNEVDPENWTGS